MEFTQHLLVYATLQPLTALMPPLDWLQCVHVFLSLGNPKLDTAQQVRYHQSQGQSESIIPTGMHVHAHTCAHMHTQPLNMILWVTAHIKNVMSTML